MPPTNRKRISCILLATKPYREEEIPLITNTSTGNALAQAAAGFFLPELIRTEDFDRFETIVADGMRSIAAECIQLSLEAFDASLREHLPSQWTLHEVAQRTLVTLVGTVTYRRSVYLDEYGRRRAWADELLGIPKRRRLSAGAFLWIVRQAAESSYRKTARRFEETTGERVSHVTVMNCVREEGRLLKCAPPAGGAISSETAFVEVDGLHLHLQSPEHRKEALPRFLYEQARKTVSFELKMAAIYCGKRQVAPGRTERGNLSVVAADDPPDAFWERIEAQLEADYDADDLVEVHVGHDGAQWCGPGRLSGLLPQGISVTGSLDPFHVMKYIQRAFPEGPAREWAVNLACRGKGGRLARMASRIASGMAPCRRREKVRELASYTASNADEIRFPRLSMGTMEGTVFHVGARRCKNNATSWSRAGAEAMCLVRAALLTGKELLRPDKGQLFTQGEKRAKEKHLEGISAATVPEVAGHGYEVATHGIGKAAAISLARRSW